MTTPPGAYSGEESPAKSAILYVLDELHALGEVFSAFRERGYTVAKVAPESLGALVAAQPPVAVVLDARLDGALDVIDQLRATPAGIELTIVAVEDHREERASPQQQAVRRKATLIFDLSDGAGVIVAAVDSMLRRTPSEPILSVRPDTGIEEEPEPLSMPPGMGPPFFGDVPDGRSAAPAILASLLPAPDRAAHLDSGPNSELSAPSSGPPAAEPSLFAGSAEAQLLEGRLLLDAVPLSADIEQILADAEQRVFAEPPAVLDRASSEEEAAIPVPPEVMAALDAPLSPEAESDSAEDSGSMRTPTGEGMGNSDRPAASSESVPPSLVLDGPGSIDGAQGLATPLPPPSGERPPESTPGTGKKSSRPPRRVSAEEVGSARIVMMPVPPRAASKATPPTEPQVVRESGEVTPSAGVEHALSPALSPLAEGLHVVAACIAARASIVLRVDVVGATRRAVLKDGDFVTCVSNAPDESLVEYLVAVGELLREQGADLGSRLAPFGRHAAAALVAQGCLGQDRLWPVLRGHAEWILERILLLQSGAWVCEIEAPDALKDEPSVFGGATGAEVLVQAALRALPADEAIGRLGGRHAGLLEGAGTTLLSECALSEQEMTVVADSAGRSVHEVLQAVGHDDFAPALVALVELGVLGLSVSSVESQPAITDQSTDAPDPEVVRRRVRSRAQTVQEGDYFSVLGVPRSASGHEIRRAYVEARRTFEPARLLTAATADLTEEVRMVLHGIEDAFDALRDPNRRERYRKALDRTPVAVD